MSEWGSWLKLFREIKSCQCTQSPDKHILKDLGILLLYVCCVSTHLPHLLQMKLAPYSFPYFSSPSYCTFHKIFCILLIIVLCHLIIPFFPSAGICTHCFQLQLDCRSPIVHQMQCLKKMSLLNVLITPCNQVLQGCANTFFFL